MVSGPTDRPGLSTSSASAVSSFIGVSSIIFLSFFEFSIFFLYFLVYVQVVLQSSGYLVADRSECCRLGYCLSLIQGVFFLTPTLPVVGLGLYVPP